MRAIRTAFVLAALATSALAAPQVIVSRFPRGIMQPVNAATEKDDFVVANGGPDQASVTLVPTKQFFTVSPQQFLLDPRTTRTITITPVVTAGGLYDGAINLFVSGVNTPISIPVRLFIGSRPSGSVNPQASASQITIAPPAGQPHSITTSIRNGGNVTMQGIMVADSPWIVPGDANVVSIAAGANAQVPFSINASSRPDADLPLGAAIGTLSMIYLKGTANNLTIEQTGTVPIGVIDIQKVAVVPQTPAPLAAGEKAVFLPALITSSPYFTDVFLSNRGTTGLANVRLFLNASSLANIAQFPTGTAAWFPFAPASIFDTINAAGALQVRNAAVGNVSVSAIRGVIPDGVNRYLTAMPALSSDGSLGAGESLLLAGLEQTPSIRTDFVLQETAGVAGGYTIAFFDAAGTPLAPTLVGSLLAFGAVTLTSMAPAGARSARITNGGSGGSRLAGHAMLVETSTNDIWTVVPGSAPSLIVPIPALAGAPPSTFDVWVANGASTPTPVTITTSGQPPHRRAVNAFPPGPTATLAAGETRKFTIASSQLGYVRVSAPVAVTATGRLTSTVGGRAGAFGTGVPALASIAGAGAGTVKRFSRAADVPNVSPPTLLLIESAGKAATVRVSIRFMFPAGSTVAGQVSASKDYALAPGQLVSVADVTHALLGSGRDALGIVYNLMVDVEVVAGDGKVLSFMQTIDQSGDLTFSTD